VALLQSVRWFPESEAAMLTTNDWSYHIRRRDELRLKGLFAIDKDLAAFFEDQAHRHSRLARQALEERRAVGNC
jgi:hypothetical protein